MKKIFLSCIPFVFAASVFGQTPPDTAAKLLQKLEKTTQDTTKVLMLSNLCQIYTSSFPDSAIRLAQRGLAIARAINYAHGQAACLVSMAVVFSQTGDNEKSLILNLEALKIAENTSDREMLYTILTSILLSYYNQQDYYRALAYAQKTIPLTGGDSSYLLLTTNNLADIYERIGRLDSAQFYAQREFDLAMKQNDSSDVGGALTILGNIQSKKHQPAMAMSDYRSSLRFHPYKTDDGDRCDCWLGMARLFRIAGEKDSCLYYAKLSFNLSAEDHFSREYIAAGQLLADFYAESKTTDSAYNYLSKVVAAKDSIFSRAKTTAIQNLTFDEDARQQQAAADRIEADHKRRNRLELVGITAGIVAVIGLFLVISKSFIVHERWVKFLGVLALLVLFEYFYMLIDPFVVRVTHESPLWMILMLLVIAMILEPAHNGVQHWIKHKVIAKNKQLRLEAAKTKVAKLEEEAEMSGRPAEDTDSVSSV
jgi:tetratricopeptide (TPR) repeat protein